MVSQIKSMTQGELFPKSEGWCVICRHQDGTLKKICMRRTYGRHTFPRAELWEPSSSSPSTSATLALIKLESMHNSCSPRLREPPKQNLDHMATCGPAWLAPVLQNKTTPCIFLVTRVWRHRATAKALDSGCCSTSDMRPTKWHEEQQAKPKSSQGMPGQSKHFIGWLGKPGCASSKRTWRAVSSRPPLTGRRQEELPAADENGATCEPFPDQEVAQSESVQLRPTRTEQDIHCMGSSKPLWRGRAQGSSGDKIHRTTGCQASTSSTLKPTLGVWQLRRTQFSV